MANIAGRRCAWCKGPIALTARRDTVTCSKRCRQARHRFTTAVNADRPALPTTAAPAGRGRRLAYADPPYPDLASRYYRDHPDFAGEVDHEQLVDELARYDGWALSTSARALPDVLRICPAGVRVAAWHRGAASFARSPYPLTAWEPVIYVPVGRAPVDDASTEVLRDGYAPGGRDGSAAVVDDVSTAQPPAVVDSLIYVAQPRRSDPARVVGAKPATYCRWIFDLLGADPHRGDTLDDLFPGSGGVARAWEIFAAAQGRPKPAAVLAV
ncbi:MULTISPECIES: hypothetical protein [Pimelobacter]|uniref:hypothetical protein n=1 Tax=Pimelobacter TaxID=2044 RepID=UPI001C04F033|nr:MULTISPECIES: hypothetical protein [Pimelobacter]MBU2698870.1 hypothetical protein [Pimelobacter sp. 30-1]UUW93003.1 hypothetical protein M0M43_30685 [Pimelobacter simplex]UUW99036.1 hypothetical protein M0M48_30705 [Pimelobacter simplex]